MTDHFLPSYKTSLALLTDFYQMTMSYGYWKAGLDKKEAVFNLFFRTLPFEGGYAISAGLQSVIDFLENFRFEDSDLDYLATLKDSKGNSLFSDDFFTYLSKMRFSCDVDAILEGTPVFPYEPLIRVQGPLIQCQILETPLLNLINFPSLIATKASRLCLASKGEPIMEFGVRRAQGIDGALTASRASYIGGCDSTSNVLAGKLFGIPIKGTHSHSWVMVFDDEIEAFRTFGKYLPDNTVFLVDTYNTLEGVEKAIKAAISLKEIGIPFLGVRLDSGDLADLSIKARHLLDESGFNEAKIFASNELDETIISELKRQGAKIAVWGVGTNLVTAKDQPSLDGVYKLAAVRDPKGPWKYKLKLSEQMKKVSNPGILQVKRFSSHGIYVGDAIYDIYSKIGKEIAIVDPFDATHEHHFSSELEAEDLLQPIFRKGNLVYKTPTLDEIRQRTQTLLARLPGGVKRFLNPHKYIVGLERTLYDMKIKLIKDIRRKMAHDYTLPEMNED